MPNRATHESVGAVSGAVVAGYAARDLEGIAFLTEVLAGYLGGKLGGRAPDLIEPAIHPWHRSVAHSCATGSGISVSLAKGTRHWQEVCRTRARTHRVLATQSPDLTSQLHHDLLALWWHFLAGLVVGFGAGYISHLVLDSMTPSGLPLLT